MKHIVKWMTGLTACVWLPCLLWGQTNDWVSLKTSELGLANATAFCLYVTDINNDQYPDIVSVTGGWSTGAENPLRVYLNVQDTSSANSAGRMFVDITASSGINVKPGSGDPSRGTLVAALADVNNDGNVDLVRGNYYHRLKDYTDPGDRCEVLLGDGRGHFTLVPDNGLHELGLVNTMGFSFLDYDKDGNIDLFIAPWFKDYDRNIWDAGFLMKGNGDGTFRNVSAQAGITQQEPMYGSSVVDWNNDGWPDIATAPYCRTNGQLWKNNGNGTFTNVAGDVGYNAQYMPGDNGQPLCMWGNIPEDYDNDGDMDFFFNLVHGGSGADEGRSTIMLNNGSQGGYRLTPDRSLTQRKWLQSAHLGDYDASWMDVDNDGLIDLVMTQGHYDPPRDRLYVFRQGADHRLTDVTLELGLTDTAQRDLHRVEAMDYDLDGDDDILYCRNAGPRSVHMLENRIGQDSHWTAVRLRAPIGVNGSCIGARVHVWSGGVRRMREVYAGRGNGAGQQPFAMLFGLGSHSVIDSIRVAWPDRLGSTTTVVNPPSDRYLEITGQGLSVEVRNRSVELIISPNPAKDYMLVQMSGQILFERIYIYDLSGREVKRQSISSLSGSTVYFSVKDLAASQYILRVVTADGKSFSKAFVKSE